MAKNDNAHSIRLLDSLRRNLGNDVADKAWGTTIKDWNAVEK